MINVTPCSLADNKTHYGGTNEILFKVKDILPWRR